MHRAQRKSFVCLLILALLLLSGCGGTREDQKKVMEAPKSEILYQGQLILRMANNQPEDFSTSQACDLFSKLAEKYTDGRIRITVYHDGELGDEKATIQQLACGGIDLARVSSTLLTDLEPELAVLQLPYIYEDSAHMWRCLDSTQGKTFLDGMQEKNVQGLCWYDAGARNFYSIDKAIREVDDLAGMQIRVQESALMAEFAKYMEGEPKAIPYDKVIQAFRSGEIDAAENNWPSYISSMHYKEAPYITEDEHTRIPEMVIINSQLFESLSSEDQEALKKAARESSVWQRIQWDKQEEAARKKAVEEGCTIIVPKDMNAFREKVSAMYEKYASDYDKELKWIRSMRKK